MRFRFDRGCFCRPQIARQLWPSPMPAARAAPDDGVHPNRASNLLDLFGRSDGRCYVKERVNEDCWQEAGAAGSQVACCQTKEESKNGSGVAHWKVDEGEENSNQRGRDQ